MGTFLAMHSQGLSLGRPSQALKVVPVRGGVLWVRVGGSAWRGTAIHVSLKGNSEGLSRQIPARMHV